MKCEFKDSRVGELVEYKFEDGRWTFADSDMMWIYDHLVLPEETFYNVETLGWNPLPYWKSCRTFVGFMDDDLVGLFWVSSWNRINKSGFFNFSFIDTCKDNLMYKLTVASAGVRLMCDHPDFRTLYAETSVCRKGVLAFADYIGFKRVGIIPNGHWHHNEGRWFDTIFMYINKDTVRR